jgi:DNA-binding transcriptional regulator YiaG
MKLTEFAEYFNIPYRTLQNWKAGIRACPSYVVELMKYRLENENKIN